ncbi:MAG: 2-C-methyl-D-erythritol 4-phosphate cytidylyltransferase [Phycisphaeraceae bacterium]|nr:2-C-methyl-D-erythritol 4-phosphate cytidylyltransferase [Phycisphaeraceae bacterium]MCB9847729.1 2-C-methyl-D-erythritol 4-phosphate cytidylyltransferase [Phycisphaeraceae bacterium]
MLQIAVIIPAAGASQRFGLGNKLDADMAGRPVIQRTVELFVKRADVASVVVAGPHDDAAFAEFRDRHGDKLGLLGATLCRGGRAHRWETVKAALEHVPGDATHIAVHDGARPAAPQELIDRVFQAAERYAAVVPAIELSDTIKRVRTERDDAGPVDPLAAILGGGDNDGSSKRDATKRIVESTQEREGLILVQTPQVFEAALLRRAYAQADLTSTDDASLLERLGEEVVVVDGDPRNIKITRRVDVAMAVKVLGLKEPAGRAAHKKF